MKLWNHSVTRLGLIWVKDGTNLRMVKETAWTCKMGNKKGDIVECPSSAVVMSPIR